MSFSHEPRKQAGKVLFAIMGIGVLLMFVVGFFDHRAWINLPLFLLFAGLGFWMWREY
jgi:hypothetical protein